MDTNLAEQSDYELVKLALKNKDAFGHLVLRYHDALHRYLLRIGCASSEDAEDILQEVFIKTYLNLNDYDSRLKFSSWIYRITHNEAVNFFYKHKNKPRAAGSEAELFVMKNIPADDKLIDNIDREINSQVVQGAMSKLKDEHREILILKYWENRSYEDISDILQKPSGTIATLIHRAKAQLKDNLTNPN